MWLKQGLRLEPRGSPLLLSGRGPPVVFAPLSIATVLSLCRHGWAALAASGGLLLSQPRLVCLRHFRASWEAPPALPFGAAAQRRLPEGEQALPSLAEVRPALRPLRLLDWILRYLPYFSRYRVRFMLRFNQFSFCMGLGYLYLWCHTPFKCDGYDHFCSGPSTCGPRATWRRLGSSWRTCASR